MGWDSSTAFEASSLGSNGLVFKSVMVKTRKEKGKESELHVRKNVTYLLIQISMYSSLPNNRGGGNKRPGTK